MNRGIFSERQDISIALIGIKSVGKTAFLNRLKDNEFTEYTLSTCQNTFHELLVMYTKNKYRLCVTDIPGEEVEMNEIHLEESDMLLMFFDLTETEKSFPAILGYLELIKKNIGPQKTLILFGTKKDLFDSVRGVGFGYLIN